MENNWYKFEKKAFLGEIDFLVLISKESALRTNENLFDNKAEANGELGYLILRAH